MSERQSGIRAALAKLSRLWLRCAKRKQPPPSDKAPSPAPAEILEATAREMADELTILANCMDQMLQATDSDDPLRPDIYDSFGAILRMQGIAGRLLVRAKRDGAKPRATSIEFILSL